MALTPGTRLGVYEGDDLSQRVARGAVPLDEALPIAKQIADALEAAHEQGIIHRDLKPANVKVRPDGTVKVQDLDVGGKLNRALHAARRRELGLFGERALGGAIGRPGAGCEGEGERGDGPGEEAACEHRGARSDSWRR